MMQVVIVIVLAWSAIVAHLEVDNLQDELERYQQPGTSIEVDGRLRIDCDRRNILCDDEED